jgi:transcription elongation factor GreB
MSGAFTKEGDAADDFPERPIPDRPNYVTEAGLAALRQAVADLLVRRAHAADKKLIDRDLRYFEARVDSAILVKHASPPPDARFGAVVTLDDGRTVSIVGEDEAEPEKGKLAWSSPLASVLIGLKPGDTAEFGGTALKVVALRY